MVRYDSLADALEVEVLTQMADTFFGARKNLDDLMDDFTLHVEELRSREGVVYSHLLYLRHLLLGKAGEQAFFHHLGLGDPFQPEPGHTAETPMWRPKRPPFAFFATTRYEKRVFLAYEQLCAACEVYMRGEYIDDPDQKGRKRMTMNFALVASLCQRLNDRIAKLNKEMTPSSVLQYARSMRSNDENGHGAISNSLGSESLDNGLQYRCIDFAGLTLWKAPELPKPEACAGKIRTFCRRYFDKHEAEIRRLLEAG